MPISALNFSSIRISVPMTAEFPIRFNAFQDMMEAWSIEANAVSTQLETDVANIADNVAITNANRVTIEGHANQVAVHAAMVHASNDAVIAAESSARDSADIAMGASNFIGPWSEQALPVPAGTAVSNNGWIFISNRDNSAEPLKTDDDWTIFKKIENFRPFVLPTLDLQFAQDKALDSRVTFTRSSSATVVDFRCRVSDVEKNEPRFEHDPVTGESLGMLIEEDGTNLIKHSGIIADFAGWVAYKGCRAYQDFTTAPDGTLTAWRIDNSANPIANMQQAISTIDGGDDYTISWFVKAGNVAEARIRWIMYGGGIIQDYSQVVNLITGDVTHITGSSIVRVFQYSDGWWRIAITDTQNNSINTVLRTDIAPPSNNQGYIYVWGVQCEKSSNPSSYIPSGITFISRATTKTYVDSDGYIKIAASNEAAYTCNPSDLSAPCRLSVEQNSINLITQSGNIGAWDGPGTITLASNLVDPMGNTGTVHYVENDGVHGSFDGTGVNELAFSFFTKKRNVDFTKIQIFQQTTDDVHSIGSYSFQLFSDNLDSTNFKHIKRVAHPNGWYRFTCKIYANSVGNGVFTASSRVDVDGLASNNYVWGFQAESTHYSTSYIPTTTMAVSRSVDITTSSATTRAKDIAYIAGTDFSNFYNQNEGTIIVSYGDITNCPTPRIIYDISDGSTANRIGAGYNSVNILNPSIYVNNITHSSFNKGRNLDESALAFAYKVNDVAASVNGGAITTDDMSMIPQVRTLYLGQRNNGYRLNSTIKSITYYPKRLADSVLQALTME